MIHSMTGYGKSEAIINTKKVTVEVKSLNGKFLDCNLRIPSLYREKEMEIRSNIATELIRGKVDFNIGLNSMEGDQTFFINKALIKAYHEELSEVIQEINLSNHDKIDFLSTLMRLPDVMRSEKPELNAEEWELVVELIQEALENLANFRQIEGKVLADDLKKRIEIILNLLEDISLYEEERIKTVKNKILKNLSEIVEEQKINQDRFEQELIYYVEKFDVSEEKVRLKGHCQHFTATMNENAGQGKKLGFITQEIGREINTLGSKANHAEMQKIVVQMKDELEKIKEQVLNVL